MLIATETTYRKLSTFDSVEQLNEATRKHKNAHDLSPTETAVLDVLSRHSCVYKGVSYLRKSNIALMIGRSRRTVIRACKRLETLGIIRQYDMKRVTGDKRQTSNAVVIMPIKEPVTPDMSHHKTTKPFKTIHTLQDTNTPAALRNSIPKSIYEALSPFFDCDGLYRTYGVLLRAKASVNKAITVEDNIEVITDIFANAIRKMKRGAIRNLDGYLYRAWAEACRVIDRQQTFSMGINSPLSYDWLK